MSKTKPIELATLLSRGENNLLGLIRQSAGENLAIAQRRAPPLDASTLRRQLNSAEAVEQFIVSLPRAKRRHLRRELDALRRSFARQGEKKEQRT